MPPPSNLPSLAKSTGTVIIPQQTDSSASNGSNIQHSNNTGNMNSGNYLLPLNRICYASYVNLTYM